MSMSLQERQGFCRGQMVELQVFLKHVITLEREKAGSDHSTGMGLPALAEVAWKAW